MEPLVAESSTISIATKMADPEQQQDAAAAAPAMNAKQRRKLLREQQRAAEETAVAGAEDVSMSEEPSVAAKEPSQKVDNVEVKREEPAAEQMNAKQRRKLARQAAKEVASATPAAAASASTEQPAAPVNVEVGEKLNAQQRRLLARQAKRGEDGTAGKTEAVAGKKRKRSAKSSSNEEESGEGEGKAARKSIHLTLFVGQLPFNATEAQVRRHFAEAGDITLRMLTDKRTKRFKGTAFIEVKDSKALGAALSRHHTLLNGRRINVELTASGGGNKSEQRRTKIDLLRKKQSTVQVDKARALLQKHADAPELKLTADDIDDRVIDFLSWFDYETAKKALDEFNRCVSERVENRKAFLMGILKRFVKTDGVE